MCVFTDDITGGSREASRESSRERAKRQKSQPNWATKSFEVLAILHGLANVVQDHRNLFVLQDQDFYDMRMPLPEVLRQRLVDNAQAVADRKVMAAFRAASEQCI